MAHLSFPAVLLVASMALLVHATICAIQRALNRTHRLA
jgi:hypothetical protein